MNIIISGHAVVSTCMLGAGKYLWNLILSPKQGHINLISLKLILIFKGSATLTEFRF